MLNHFMNKGFSRFFVPLKVQPVIEGGIEPVRIPVCFRHAIVCTNVIKLSSIRGIEFRIFAIAVVLMSFSYEPLDQLAPEGS